MMERIAEASPRLKARIAGAFFLLALLAGVVGEFFVRGRLSTAGDSIAVLCYLAVTLFLYYIFKAVNRNLTLLAVSFNLVGLAFEALRWTPQGVDLGIVFHGFYCLLIGYVIFKSTLLPRILGALIAFAGLAWLTFLSLPLANHLSPFNLVAGLVGEASLMLWLLAMGVNVQRWKEQAGPTSHPV